MEKGEQLRILMLVGNYYPIIGGMEKQCGLLVRELIHNGTDVRILTSCRKGFRTREIIDGARVWRLPLAIAIPSFIQRNRERIPFYRFFERIWGAFSGAMGDLSILVALFVLRKRYDILHVHTLYWKRCHRAVVLAKLMSKKVLVAIMSYVEISNLRKIDFNAANKSDGLIAISKDIYQGLLKKGVSENRISYCPNGVDLPKTPVDVANFALRTVVTIGNLHQHPWKGLDVLLESWSLAVKQFPDAKLIVVGEDNSKGQAFHGMFKDLAERLNISCSVRFAGRVNHPEQILKSSSFFVLPSRVEGMSNALLEAMACGLPCIVTNISGSRDLIQDGVNGFLVPPEDPKALAEKIIYLLDHTESAQRLGQAARRTIIEGGYQIGEIAGGYLKLYRSLLKMQKTYEC